MANMGSVNKPLISYIIPVYQAESFIYNNLNLFTQYCINSNLSSEIIIVNDGSTDRTNELIEGFLREDTPRVSIKYINIAHNKGKGFAVKKGVEVAEGRYIVFTDCDLPYSFKSIGALVNELLNSNSNIVIGSRMHKDSIYKIRSADLSRIYVKYISGRVFNCLVNLFTNLNIKDTQAGLKGFDHVTAKLIFEKMTILGFSFDVDVLTCAKEHKKKITTIPVEFNCDSKITTVSFIKQVFVMTLGVLCVFLKKITGYYKR